jgi:recombination protein RecA
VVDSLAAACPKAEYEGEMTDFAVGLRARLGNKFVRKSKGRTNLLEEEYDLGKTTVLVVNQTYKNIGGYGDPDVTPGGEQVKFGAMIRVKIRKGDVINDSKDGTQIMQESRFTVVKNKTHPPHKAGAFWFSTQDNPKGKAGEIYRTGEIITYGILTDIIKRSGAWYYLPEYFGEVKFHGEPKLADWVIENPEAYLELEEMIMKEIIKIGE